MKVILFVKLMKGIRKVIEGWIVFNNSKVDVFEECFILYVFFEFELFD